jgi:hypothetical protein
MRLKDPTNTDIVMNRMFCEGIYCGVTRPMPASLADPIRKYPPQAAR